MDMMMAQWKYGMSGWVAKPGNMKAVTWVRERTSSTLAYLVHRTLHQVSPASAQVMVAWNAGSVERVHGMPDVAKSPHRIAGYAPLLSATLDWRELAAAQLCMMTG